MSNTQVDRLVVKLVNARLTKMEFERLGEVPAGVKIELKIAVNETVKLARNQEGEKFLAAITTFEMQSRKPPDPQADDTGQPFFRLKCEVTGIMSAVDSDIPLTEELTFSPSALRTACSPLFPLIVTWVRQTLGMSDIGNMLPYWNIEDLEASMQKVGAAVPDLPVIPE